MQALLNARCATIEPSSSRLSHSPVAHARRLSRTGCVGASRHPTAMTERRVWCRCASAPPVRPPRQQVGEHACRRRVGQCSCHQHARTPPIPFRVEGAPQPQGRMKHLSPHTRLEGVARRAATTQLPDVPHLATAAAAQRCARTTLAVSTATPRGVRRAGGAASTLHSVPRTVPHTPADVC